MQHGVACDVWERRGWPRCFRGGSRAAAEVGACRGRCVAGCQHPSARHDNWLLQRGWPAHARVLQRGPRPPPAAQCRHPAPACDRRRHLWRALVAGAVARQHRGAAGAGAAPAEKLQAGARFVGHLAVLRGGECHEHAFVEPFDSLFAEALLEAQCLGREEDAGADGLHQQARLCFSPSSR